MVLKLEAVLYTAGFAAGQAAVEQGHAFPDGKGQGNAQAAVKGGAGVGAGVPVGHLAVDERHGPGAAFVDILPAATAPDQEEPKAVFALQPAGAVRCVLD